MILSKVGDAGMTELEVKLMHLKSHLSKLERILVAFSGGVDSSLLLAVAQEMCGERVMAATASGPMVPPAEQDRAREIAASLGVRHMFVDVGGVLSCDEIAANPPNRCYLCKKFIFTKLADLARTEGYATVVDGTNADDCLDYRPGLKALDELGVISPLAIAEISKAEVRTLAREYNLPNWNKPSAACLASRIPYSQRLTEEKLRRIDRAEEAIRKHGFDLVRVRCHGDSGDIALIEVKQADLPALIASAASITTELKRLGFRYVTADMCGYRTGSLNERLTLSGS